MRKKIKTQRKEKDQKSPVLFWGDYRTYRRSRCSWKFTPGKPEKAAYRVYGLY